MHLTEETYRQLSEGQDFPGAEELAAHLETSCPECEAFLGNRKPGSLAGDLVPTRATPPVPAPAPAPAARPTTPAPAPSRLAAGGRIDRSMRTENLAIVFTDIKGFTERTSRQTRAENERLLKVHEMLLAPVFKAFGGTVRKTIGDAFMVTFESPTNAVLCGIAIQDRLFSFNQTAPESDRMEIRVAINIGEVRVEANDVFGEPVNVAARVEGVAEANEVWFTEAVYLVMNKAEVPSEPMGEHEFKGVPEKVRVYRVPRGPYRMTTGALAAQNVPEPSLPYGGLGLARAPALSPPDLPSIERALAARQSRRESWNTLAHRARESLESAGLLRQGRLGGRALGAVGAAVGLVAVLLVARLAFTPRIERLIRAGEFNEASTAIDKLPEGPEQDYWSGRLSEEKRQYPQAVDDYTAAAKDKGPWRKRSIDRLDEIAQKGKCGDKVKVARAIGTIGDPYGASVLDHLGKEKGEEEGGLGGIFGGRCDPAQAADRARAKLGGKE